MSARLAARRLALSWKIRVAGAAARRWNSFRRAAGFGGGKPANRNLSVGRPDRISPVIPAEGPGTAVTGMSASMQARTSR